MRKYCIIILLILALMPVAFACSTSNSVFDNILDTCADASNHVCDNGENPLTSNDCKVNSDFTFFTSGWFIKLLILGVVIFILSRTNVLKDRKLLILIIFVMAIVYLFSTGMFNVAPKPIIPTTTTSTTLILHPVTTPTSIPQIDTLIIQTNSSNGAWDSVNHLGNQVWPSQPLFGWLIIILGLIILIPVITVMMDVVEGLITRF